MHPLLFALLQALPADASPSPPPYSVLLIGALSPVVVALVGVINHRKGKTRDAGRKTEFEQLQSVISANHLETTQQFTAVSKELLELRGFVVGPDGQNGLRGDVRELKAQVDGLVDRERDRLEAKAYGGYDRRAHG